MLYRDEFEYKLMPYKAKFKQHGKTHNVYAPNKEELKAHEQIGNIQELTFEDAEYSGEQRSRLEEVKHLDETHFGSVVKYVEDGLIEKGSAIARDKELQSLKETVDTLVFESLLGGF